MHWHYKCYYLVFIECACDVGGAHGPVCNKTSGQCHCKENITQQHCDRLVHSFQLHCKQKGLQFRFMNLALKAFQWKQLMLVKPNCSVSILAGLLAHYNLQYCTGEKEVYELASPFAVCL